MNGEPIDGVDSAWLRMARPCNLMTIAALAVVDPIEMDDLRRLILERFLCYHRFKCKPVSYSGVYFWEPEEAFDLDCHIRRTALPGAAGKAELQQLMSDLVSTPLDSNRPLWQFHLVENYAGRMVIILRVHHCYADGISLMSVFGTLTDATPDSGPHQAVADADATEEVAANDASMGRDQPGVGYRQFWDAATDALERCTRLSMKFSEESLHLLREPASAQAYGRVALSLLGEVARLAALPSDPPTGLKGPLGSFKHCVWSDSLPLARFKTAGRRLGCSVNDVLLSCVSGILRRHLNGDPGLSPGLEIRAAVPVNIRFDDESADVPEALGNRFGLVFVSLPIGIRNPLERIYRIKHEVLSLRRSALPGISYTLLAGLGLIPGRLQQPFIDAFSQKASLVLSNVPGSREQRFIAGRTVHELLFWVPQSGEIALGISLLSYNGKVQIGLQADKRVFQNPESLVMDFERELAEHEMLAQHFQFLGESEEPDSQAASVTTARA